MLSCNFWRKRYAESDANSAETPSEERDVAAGPRVVHRRSNDIRRKTTAGTRPLGLGIGYAERMGPSVGCNVRQDGHEPMDHRDSAAQAHRAGRRWPQCRLHEISLPTARTATFAPRPKREQLEKRFSSYSMRHHYVDPLVQPRCADSSGRSEGSRRDARPERRGTNAGVQQDDGREPVESGVGSVR
jgi:hypothetical protein